MSLLGGVVAGILADKAVGASATARQRAATLRRNTRFSDELGPIATEFNDAIGERLQARAEEIDSVALYNVAMNWDVIASDLDVPEIAFESEDAAVEWLVDEIDAHDDVDLDDDGKAELRQLLGEEYAAAVARFRDRVASDEQLETHLQAQLDLTLREELAAMREAFDRLGSHQPYQLHDFPGGREAVLETLLSDDPVPFIDRPEVPETPAVDRHFLLGPSGAGKSRIIAERVRRLPDNAVAHILVPDARMLDPADAKALARQSFDGDLLLVWEDVHRVDESGENTVLERTLRELAYGLTDQDHRLYTLLEARSGRIDDVPGSLPADFENEKSLWSDYEPLFVGDLDDTHLHDLADAMADRFEVSLDETAREQLVDRIRDTKSAPVYIETALVTAGDKLTAEEIEGLGTEVEEIWQSHYESLRDDAPAEWTVLVALKLLYDINVPLYAKLVRAVYTDLLDGDRTRFRPAVEALRTRQWLTIGGPDLVSRETRYEIHDTQLDAVQASATDDAEGLSSVLLDRVGQVVPESAHLEAYVRAGTVFGNADYYEIAKAQFDAACALDTEYAPAYRARGITHSFLDEYEAAIEDYDRAIDLDPEDVTAHKKRGDANLKLGKHEAAIEDYDRAINLDPEHALAHRNRGIAKARLGEYEAAIEDYDRSIDLDPSDATAYRKRGDAKGDMGDHEAALDDLDRAVDLAPDDAAAYRNRGFAKMNLREYEAAIEDLDRAIDLDPENATAYRRRGVSKANLGEYEAAIEDFDRAIELDPDDSAAYRRRGDAKGNLGNHAAARDDFDRAIELNSENATAYRNRGKAKVHLEEYEAAIEDFNRAIDLHPGDATAHRRRGTAKAALGAYEAALDDFERAVELAPEDATAHRKCGDIKANMGRAEAAIDHYDHAIALNPDDVSAYRNRGILKADLGNHEAAVDDFDRAIELEPAHAPTYRHRGNAHVTLGEYEAAIDDYDRAIERDPDDAIAHRNRAIAKAELDKHTAAIDDFDRAIELGLQNASTYNTRGIANADLGEYEAAIEDFDRALEIDPDHLNTLRNRAEVHLVQRQLDAARRDAERTRRLAEQDGEVAFSLLVSLIADNIDGRESGEKETEYRSLCEQGFDFSWQFDILRDWLADADLPADDMARIEELLSLFNDASTA